MTRHICWTDCSLLISIVANLVLDEERASKMTIYHQNTECIIAFDQQPEPYRKQ